MSELQSAAGVPIPYLHGMLIAGALLVLAMGMLVERARRRRAERVMCQLQTRTRDLLCAAADIMFVLDRNGRVLQFHGRHATFPPRGPEGFLNRELGETMPPQPAGTIMMGLHRACERREPVVVEFDLVLDERRYFEARLVPDEGRAAVLVLIRDITAFRRASELNRTLAARLIASQEQERTRIARELHDDLGQKIALLNIEIDVVAGRLSAPDDRAHVRRISLRAAEIARDVHQLSYELHPSRLHTLGLTESIRLLCAEISRQHQLNVSFAHAGPPHTLDPDISLCLYRIAQEALHNVTKHSQAREASVRLEGDGTIVHLQINDSGIGFDVHAGSVGLGLVSMQERVGALKGELAIEAFPGRGVRIDARVPSNLADPAKVCA